MPPTLNGSSTPDAARPDWADLVARIIADEPSGMEELYDVFSHGIRFYLCRHLGSEELDDLVHDTFLIVVQAIRRGELREPQRLMGFVRTIVRRQVATYIDRAVQSRKGQAGFDSGLAVCDERRDPEQDLIARQQVEIMEEVLRSIPSRDREILTRFYLLGQPVEQICQEMNLNETQFRLLKSRAKTRFGELGRRRIGRRFAADAGLETPHPGADDPPSGLRESERAERNSQGEERNSQAMEH